MSKVHLFPIITSLHPDTRIPLQYPGGGATPTPVQFELTTLLMWLESNLALSFSTSASVSSTTYSFTIPAGKWLVAVAAESATTQTFKCGLTALADDLISEGIVASGEVSTFSINLYGGASGNTIYFSALTGTVELTFLTI